jgi:protein-tyrosine phosphatase
LIDLHTHILPSIDDGAADFDTAVEMCKLAQEDGCRVLVATPHHRHPLFAQPEASAVRAALARLQAAIGPSLRLVLGGEIHVDDQLVVEMLERHSYVAPTLGESRAVLLEFPHELASHDPVAVVHELLVAGFRPVLAHPEMLPWLARDLDLIRRLVRRGVLVQLTAQSVTGRFGSPARNAAREIIEAGLAHVISSDCHDAIRRPPGLSDAYNFVLRRWGRATADQLMVENPRAILTDQPLERAA